MTNIIATILITVVTNVVEVDNAQYAKDYSTALLSNPVQYPSILTCPATEKTVTTTVTEVTKLAFQWQGKQRLIEDRRVISEDKKRYVRKEEWVAERGAAE